MIIPSTKIFEGNNFKISVRGNFGRVVDTISPSGRIFTAETPDILAEATPFVSTYSAPVTYPATPALSAYLAPVSSRPISQEDTFVEGPSGQIATSKTVAGPALIGQAPAYYASRGLYF